MHPRRNKFIKQRCATADPKPLFVVVGEKSKNNKHKSLPFIFRELSKNLKEMIDIKNISESVKEKCITISRDLLKMDAAQRMVFLTDEAHFPGTEKMVMLNTCISILEEVEEYETCATLHKMRLRLAKK